MVDSRCAMTKLVRPLISAFIALPISTSVRVSTLEVASSRIRIGGLHRKTRAMVSSWRCPAERLAASLSSMVSYPCGMVRIK